MSNSFIYQLRLSPICGAFFLSVWEFWGAKAAQIDISKIGKKQYPCSYGLAIDTDLQIGQPDELSITKGFVA